MTNEPKFFGKVANVARCYWIGGVTVVLIALILLRGAPTWAAPAAKPVNQTVPQPTATKEATSVPKATNTPHPHKDNNDNNDNNNDNNNQPAPTPTPQQPAPGNGPTGVVIADRLNVRQGPGTNFAVLGKVERDQTVRILNRNAAGDWWRICCVTGGNQEGWVSAKFIQPNFDAAQTNDLVPIAEDASVVAPVPAVATQIITPTTTTNVTSTEAVSAAAAVTSTTPTTSPLALTMQQTPALVWQGSQFEIGFAITNTGSVAVTNVELRDELPQELKFITSIVGSDGKAVPQSNVDGKYIVDMQWPELAAGASVTGTIKLLMAPNLPDGSVIDNLAVAAGENVASNTAGVSLGLPPATLPDFQ